MPPGVRRSIFVRSAFVVGPLVATSQPGLEYFHPTSRSSTGPILDLLCRPTSLTDFVLRPVLLPERRQAVDLPQFPPTDRADRPIIRDQIPGSEPKTGVGVAAGSDALGGVVEVPARWHSHPLRLAPATAARWTDA
jgi:hypothetical protein